MKLISNSALREFAQVHPDANLPLQDFRHLVEAAPWAAINAAMGLAAPIRDEAHYTDLLDFVDECFERFGSDDAHPVFALVDWVAPRIADYVAVAHPWSDNSTPATRLAFFMDQHGLRQCDLPEVGAQSMVSGSAIEIACHGVLVTLQSIHDKLRHDHRLAGSHQRAGRFAQCRAYSCSVQ
jgi:HTH-type transcriptional regulator/antitoxin HigA